MEELELLKKDWNKDKPEHKKLAATDIYPMLHKKSSSIAKTLFYISIAELVFWILVSIIPYFTSDSYRKRVESIYTNDTFFTVLNILTYGIVLLFIYLLFKSHKAISVTDNAKKLMESILKTRKIIKYYVLYNLIIAGISIVAGTLVAINQNPELSNTVSHFSDKQKLLGCAIVLGVSIAFVLIIWLFYRLLYGLLLKRLKRNYNELKKLEV
ncbi:MAG TPA: hypothetical protein PKD13_08800 [Mariniflexile sp.]|nr:hypothetical protein [Mariniflexile sp.]